MNEDGDDFDKRINPEEARELIQKMLGSSRVVLFLMTHFLSQKSHFSLMSEMISGLGTFPANDPGLARARG